MERTTKLINKVFGRLFFLGIVGLLLFLLYKGLFIKDGIAFFYGFIVVLFDFFLIARFSFSFLSAKTFKKNFYFLSMVVRYFIVFPFLYFAIRLAPDCIFAIISGAVWATFAFTITIITLLKERSGWSTEEHNSSHGR